MKPRNNHKASQGGLTSPKLYDSGPDFSNRSRKRWKGRHVRISCINVTNTLSSVVIISHPNQLQYCHTSLFAQSQVLHKCLCESVAHLSRCRNVTSSVVFMFSANRCGNVTVANMSVKCGIYVYANRCSNVTLQKCHVKRQKCHVAQMSHLGPNRPHLTPPMEKLTPPMEIERTLRGNLLPLRWKSSTPRWKMT